MRHIRFICFITLLALIPYSLHVWLWSLAGGLDSESQAGVGACEFLVGYVVTLVWLCKTGFDVIAAVCGSFWALCSNELKLWKGEE